MFRIKLQIVPSATSQPVREKITDKDYETREAAIADARTLSSRVSVASGKISILTRNGAISINTFHETLVDFEVFEVDPETGEEIEQA